MTTTMILQIISLVTMYPLLFVIYFLLRNAGGVDKAYIYGATLKKEYRTETEVIEITKEYKQKMKRAMIVLAIVPIVSFFIPYMSINMTFWMLWLLVVCFFPMYYAAKANVKVQELKRKRGWYENYETSYVDLKIACVPRKVSIKTFLAPLVCSFIPIVVSFVVFRGYGYRVYPWIVATFGACTLLFYVAAVWTDKQKIMVISTDSNVNVNYARAKKKAWKSFWMWCIWINTVFTWFLFGLLFIRERFTWALIIGSVVYGFIIMSVTIVVLKKLNAIEKSYEDKKDIVDAADDDRNWIFGMIYYNKNDKHYMTQTRFGMGTTVNVANKAGLLTELFEIVALLSIPVVCIWMIMVEFTPLQVKVENDVIICEQLDVEYEIPLAQIKEYEVITELPDFIKVTGTGMDNQLLGTFEVYRKGMFKVFLNPQNDKFIYIVTEEQKYYIGGMDDAMTDEIIMIIQEKVN